MDEKSTELKPVIKIMRILLTTHQFFPQFSAGTEVLTLSVARELLRRGHEVHIYTGYPTNKALLDHERFDEYEFEGIHVYRFHHEYVCMGGQSSLIKVGYDNVLAARHFERILKNFNPDIIHFFHLNRLGTGLIEKANQARTPAYATLTDFWAICPTGQLLLPSGKLCDGPNLYAGNCVKHFAQNSQKGFIGGLLKWLPITLFNFFTKLTLYNRLPAYPNSNEVAAISDRLNVNVFRLNLLKKIIAPNQLLYDVLVKNGVRKELILKSSYGIDVIYNEDRPLQSERKHFRIGFIGTLAEHKGCHVLIEAFNMLPNDSAILKIYGSPDEHPEYFMKLKSISSKNTNVEFCGTFDNSKILNVISDFDVLVVPSIWLENTPLVIYSAQAARCPVVGSNFKGISDVIKHNHNGLLFQPGNYEDLADILLRLIKTPALVSRLSKNAKLPKTTYKYVDELLTIWAS